MRAELYLLRKSSLLLCPGPAVRATRGSVAARMLLPGAEGAWWGGTKFPGCRKPVSFPLSFPLSSVPSHLGCLHLHPSPRGAAVLALLQDPVHEHLSARISHRLTLFELACSSVTWCPSSPQQAGLLILNAAIDYHRPATAVHFSTHKNPILLLEDLLLVL